MNVFLVIVTLLIVFAVWYALKGRQWLKAQPWAEPFFAWIEPVEIALFQKSETMLMGRLIWLGGLIVTAYDAVAVFITSLDLTPITNRLFAWLPEDMRGLAASGIIVVLGFLITWLRKRTTKPLEVVAAPADISPAAAAVVAAAEDANTVAVAMVKNEQAAS